MATALCHCAAFLLTQVPFDGVRGLKRATDVAQSPPVRGEESGKGRSRARWEDQVFYLYVKDPTDARLVITVMEQVTLHRSSWKEARGTSLRTSPPSELQARRG